MRQDQVGGEGSQNNQAARDVVHITHNNYGVSEERFQELGARLERLEDQALELWERNARRLLDEAKKVYDERAMKIALEVFKRVLAKDPALLESFSEPRAQIALLNIQETFGENPDEDLGATLSNLVAELVAEPAGGRREMLLRRAINCARVLTPKMIKVLSAVFWINHRNYDRAIYLDQLINGLDRDLAWYYDQIPTNAVDLSYLGTTEAGTYYGQIGPQIYEKLHNRYINIMYEPFTLDELPQVVQDANYDEEGNGLQPLFGSLPKREGAGEEFRIMPEPAAEILDTGFKGQMESISWDTPKKQLRTFILERAIDKDQFRSRIAELKPKLAEFLNQIESTAADGFELSVIGMVLAQQEIAVHDPAVAADIDDSLELHA